MKKTFNIQRLLECDRLWEAITIALNGLSLCMAFYWVVEVGSAALPSAAAAAGTVVFLQTKSEVFLQALEDLIRSLVQETVKKRFYHETRLILAIVACLATLAWTSSGSFFVGERFLQKARAFYYEEDYYHAQVQLDKAVAFRQNEDACPSTLQAGIYENGFQDLAKALVGYEKAMNGCLRIQGALGGINALRIRTVQDLLSDSKPLHTKLTVAFGERLEEAFSKYKVGKKAQILKGLLLKWLALAYINDGRFPDAADALKKSIELGIKDGYCLKNFFPNNYWGNMATTSKICINSLKNDKGKDIKGFLEVNYFREKARKTQEGND